MVYIKKVFVEGNKALYFYQPESKGRFGEILFDLDQEKFEVLNNPEEGNDIEDFYLRHVVRKLIEYKKLNNFKEEDTIY
ncbi:hypothetical protein ACTNDG_03120 [Clostridium sp. HCP1S3_B4]|mgnify:CR=1 FL=1|uniref:hypothetical protein n=1 Tax=unclassified Clostridium TaxID=2614128 RepID=UPI0016A30831|nr:hypothetical protein [Clostridiales bacterium]MDY2730417.1 hypothetical protein [Clostridium sp.]NLK22812.1 hypothetical protein [Clostridiales bacterium]